MTDLAVQPRTGNAFMAVMRGQGAGARPALIRVDGAGKIELVDFARTTATKVTLPNPAQRVEGITDMAFMDGRLYVAGLSNEEFASKLRSIPYPFVSVDNGTSVEIYHGSHGALETRSPVYTFVPYRVDNTPHLIAGYLCTPLVKFPVSSLKPGEKVRGTTIAELGAGNRPIDMVLYQKGGRDYLLMSNTRRGVMKIPTEQFASAPAITARVSDKGGIGYETVTAMTGVEQLDLLNETQSLVLARVNGTLNLNAVALAITLRFFSTALFASALALSSSCYVLDVSCGFGGGPKPLEIRVRRRRQSSRPSHSPPRRRAGALPAARHGLDLRTVGRGAASHCRAKRVVGSS